MFTRGLTLVNQLCYIKCFLQAPVLCTGTQVQHSWPKNKHKEPTPLSRRTKKTQRLCSTCWEDRVKGNGHSRCADHRHEEDKGVCRRQTDTCRDRGSCIRQRYHMKLNQFTNVTTKVEGLSSRSTLAVTTDTHAVKATQTLWAAGLRSFVLTVCAPDCWVHGLGHSDIYRGDGRKNDQE